MVEYNKANVKSSVTQLKKLKTAVKNKTGTNLRISLKMFDGNDLPHELLLTTRQKTKLRNAFNNNMSTERLEISKARISKMIWSRGFLGSLLSKLTDPLMKVAVPFAKNILAPLGIIATASLIDAGTQSKIHGSGAAALIISNEEMNDIMKIVQAFEYSNILLEGATETIKNETRKQEGRFLGTLVGTLGSILLGNLLSEKGIVLVGSGNKKGKGIERVDILI